MGAQGTACPRTLPHSAGRHGILPGMRALFLHLALGAILAGCAGEGPKPVTGPGPRPDGTAASTAPLPEPHPAVAALERKTFDFPDWGLSGEYPGNWQVPDYTPDTNAILQLRIGKDTYADLGYLPGVRRQVAAAMPEMETQELDDTLLEQFAQGLFTSRNYFLGARRTLLDYSRILFGEHEVLVVTQLIRRPLGNLDQLDELEREDFVHSQQHYLELCPEGERRITRQYAWLLGDDVWVAQVVAPPATFLQRSLEIEEVLLPGLRWVSPAGEDS